MNLLFFAAFFVLCSAIQAITFSTVASVTVAVLGLNKPVHGFFGLFRRRKSPVKETIIPTEPPNPLGFGGQQGFMNSMNPYGGFGGLNMFPGMNAPQFGMFGQNRFPPQFQPPPPAKKQQGFPPQQSFPPQQQKKSPPPQQPPMNFPPQQKPPQQPPTSFQPQHQFSTQQPDSMDDMDSDDFSDEQGDENSPPGMNTEEAESFFTLLAETDESKCISRLVCEMGANPDTGGDFGRTIVEIISSLTDFPRGSKVSEYNEVLNIGMIEGLSACLSKFSTCDDESYDLVKAGGEDGEGEGE